MNGENSDRLERDLRAALPEQSAPEAFRMELQRRLSAHHSRPRRRRPFVGLAGLAAALVLTVGYLIWPLLSGANLPGLPPLTALGRETQGASGGPGFTAVLNYRLEGNLGQLPKRATVKRYAPPAWSAEAIQQLAERLGVTGQPEQQAWQDTYIWSIGSTAEMITAFPDGYVNYYRQTPERWSQQFPSEAEQIASAQAFLVKLGIAPEAVRVRQVRPGDQYSPAFVIFAAADYPEQISISPYVGVAVGADGQTYGASFVWPSSLQSSLDYPTRSLEQAWADVQAGQGKLVIDYTQLNGPVTGEQLLGSGTVTSSSVGYVLTYGEDNQMVMQPVAAFHGQASFADGQQAPFTVYVALISSGHYGK